MDNKEKIANMIINSEKGMTFPEVLKEMENLGMETKGDLDFLSDSITNCVYWKGINLETLFFLKDIGSEYNLALQPYGFDNKGVTLYKEYFPDQPIFNHFLLDKMSAKYKAKFMRKPYMMPAYWLPYDKTHIITKH